MDPKYEVSINYVDKLSYSKELFFESIDGIFWFGDSIAITSMTDAGMGYGSACVNTFLEQFTEESGVGIFLNLII